jgi:hypothetical protein
MRKMRDEELPEGKFSPEDLDTAKRACAELDAVWCVDVPATWSRADAVYGRNDLGTDRAEYVREVVEAELPMDHLPRYQEAMQDRWLSVRVSMCMSVCDGVSVSVCLSLFLLVCLSVCRSVCLFVALSICLIVCRSFCWSVCLFVALSVYLSVCLSLCLFVCRSFCWSVCLFVALSVCLSLFLSV